MDRDALIQRFDHTRRRSAAIFDLVVPNAYYARPIPLRNPIVFYEGHLPAFNVNTLLKKGLGRPGFDERLETLFARGIDPEDEAAAARTGAAAWPAREEVQAYAARADQAIVDALQRANLDRADRPAMRRGEAVHAIIEHELMHQETLLYILHRLPYEQKVKPATAALTVNGTAPRPATAVIDGGVATLGADPDTGMFGWDNEFPMQRVEVPRFEIDVFNVTNEQFLEFVDAGGYQEPKLWTPDDWSWRTSSGVDHPPFWVRRNGGWQWQGMFEEIPLPPAWPVYVTHAEASAYARWKRKRLPTEPEFHRAAYGTASGEERSYPWGEAPPDPDRGNFGFQSWEPVPVGSHPSGQSAWGVQDLVGNGWEWTSTIFAGFPGFQAMPSYPEYSADFFDGRHYVIKGASPATATELLRRSFRNWFRPQYPYIYAAFRCVSPA